MKKLVTILSLIFLVLLVGWYVVVGGKYVIHNTYEKRTNEMDGYFKTLMENQNGIVAKDGEYVFSYNDVDVFTNAKSKYEQLFEDVKNAKKSIHVEYYKISNDEIGRAFLSLLTEKAKEGVEVKVIYDGVINRKQGDEMYKALKEAGAEVKGWRKNLIHGNFRLHRKIVIIDNEVAFTGGMNVGNKYLSLNKEKSPWRDTQVRINGNGVAYMQYYFLKDWVSINGNSEMSLNEFKQYIQPVKSSKQTPLSFFYSGPSVGNQVMRDKYVELINEAKKSIVIETPYIIPDKKLLNALKEKAKDGISVSFVIPGYTPDVFLRNVTNANMAELINSGAKIYLYDGYMHAKSMVIDKEIVIIGSANIDVRSMNLNEEMFVYIEDKQFAERYDTIMKKDFGHAVEMEYEHFQQRGKYQRFIEKVSALLTPIL